MKIFVWYEIPSTAVGRSFWIVMAPDLEAARKIIEQAAKWPIARHVPPDEVIDCQQQQESRILHVG